MGEPKGGPPRPPPPPPPPPLPSGSILQDSKLYLIKTELLKIDEDKLDIAINRLCSSDSKFQQTFYLCNTNLKPQLQGGPNCGLVALSIATSLSENFINVDDIYQTAVSLGFTKQGEIFCVNSLSTLADKYGFKTRIIKGGLNTHLICILKSLMRKCLLLVPYDVDFNHAPCCKQGTKAHWAIITGFVILEQKQTSKSDKNNNDFVLLSNSNSSTRCNCSNSSNDIDLPLTICIHEEKTLIGKSILKKNSCYFEEGKLYLIGLQGKSSHIGLWSFNEMADSNDNLLLFPTTRDPDCYVLPVGGLEEGLKGKAIILDSPTLP